MPFAANTPAEEPDAAEADAPIEPSPPPRARHSGPLVAPEEDVDDDYEEIHTETANR
jgi:hypothetical protein